MYDFVELLCWNNVAVTLERIQEIKKKKNGAVFDVLPRLYKGVFTVDRCQRNVSIIVDGMQTVWSGVLFASPFLKLNWVGWVSPHIWFVEKRSCVFWISGLEGKVQEEAIIGNWDAFRLHVEVLRRIFSVKKQFRGNRLIFYNLWDFMWRVFWKCPY